jgi:hypothetical protein
MNSIERSQGSTPVSTPAFTEVRYHAYQSGDTIESLEVKKAAPSPGCVRTLDNCLESAWKVVKNFFVRLFRLITCYKRPDYVMPQLNLEKLFSDGDIATMRDNWRGLGDKKWMEIIDGKQHKYGKYVFDKGLHGRAVEPGFILSFENNVVPLIEAHLGTRTTPEFFLAVHEAACWHFDGDRTDTLMGPEKIGVFRGEDDDVRCHYNPDTSEAADWYEFHTFEPPIGKLKWTDETKTKIVREYKVFTREQVRQIMSLMLDDFYDQILVPGLSHRDKLRLCARLGKEMIWLHPPRDGALRGSIAILQKHLTEFVGHPVILEDPHMMAQKGLENFTDYLQEGYERWERERVT